MSSPQNSSPAPRQPGRAESAATQTRILDAAEELFIEMGFAATSLRAIAARAGVNLSAAHYHFGSKEGLLGATVHRRIAGANELRLAGLDELEARSTPATVEQIIALFFEPLTDKSLRTGLPQLMARIYAEPESISKPLLEREFGVIGRRFVAALAKALPDTSSDQLRWRFHFVVGAMIQLLNFERPMGMLPGEHSENDGLSELLQFASAGIRQGGERSQATPRLDSNKRRGAE